MCNRLVVFVFLVFIGMSSCLRPDGARPIVGGKGGHATIRVHPYNGSSGQWLQQATVYIKYATWDAPAESTYDDSAQCVKTDSMITAIFTGLKAGDYYITVRGYDSSTHIPTYVQGGNHIIFESEEVVIANVPARKP